jgi:hypothetical protein
MGNMIRANDGGFIITGKSTQLVFGNPGMKLFAMKVDSLGNKLWTKTYRYISRLSKTKIAPTQDGYLIVGGSQLLKIDNDGKLIWEKEVPTPDHGYTGATVDRIGQVYVAGSLYRDSANNRSTAFLHKFDAQGNLVSEIKYSPTTWDTFCDVKLSADGNHLLLAGVTDRNNITMAQYNGGVKKIEYDFVVYKLKLDGSIVWKHIVLRPLDALDGSLTETREGNVVLTGGNAPMNTNTVSLVLNMIDKNGTALWTYRNDELAINGQCVAETGDNNLIITGYTNLVYSNGFYLAKFSKTGKRIWYEHFFESGMSIGPKSVIPLGDGGYFVNSIIEGYVGLFRTDAQGKFY